MGARPGGGGAALSIPSVVLETAVGIFMLAVASWFWFDSYSIETRAPSSLSGPVAFPRGVAAMLAVCSVLFAWRSVAARLRTGQSRAIPVERPLPVLVSMVLVVLYPLLLEWLGYYVATGVWLPVLLWVSGYRRPIGIALVSAGFLAFTKVVFQQMLGTPLP
jgi:putative tricarboxylic transport membrane protein